MAIVNITGENQWYSDSNGTFKPGVHRGQNPIVLVSIGGAPSGATVVTLRLRPVGSATWRTWMTFGPSDIPISFTDYLPSGWEVDIGVATGAWGSGTLTVEIA